MSNKKPYIIDDKDILVFVDAHIKKKLYVDRKTKKSKDSPYIDIYDNLLDMNKNGTLRVSATGRQMGKTVANNWMLYHKDDTVVIPDTKAARILFSESRQNLSKKK